MDKIISIRTYLPQDSEATIDVFLRAIREGASKDYSLSQISAWAQVPDPVTWGKHRLTRPAWVAVCDGKVIGFSDLMVDGYLDMMFVHPEYQGLGVASNLLKHIEEEAQRLGLQRVYTEASLTARPFFEHRGFQVIKEQTVEKRGQIFINFMMEKHYPLNSKI